ncbi:CHASE domain-containing protein, partial [Chitinivorax sp. B]|uniref:CHASE domain-containing protein n=1 Tax=Chitinivorax sp. B TaxID=2502235 RepID=UPI0014852EE7
MFSSLLAIILCCSTLAIAWVIHHQDRAIAEARFQEKSRQLQARLSERLETYQQVLRGLVSHFNARGEVVPAEFHDYIQSQSLLDAHPGLLGIGFARRVPAGQLPRFEAAMQSRHSDFRIHPPGQRPYHAIVELIYPPRSDYLPTIGFDAYSEPARREALELSARQGRAAATASVVLFYDKSRSKAPGFLLYWPYYGGGNRTTMPAADDPRLGGWVYAACRIHELVAGAGMTALPLKLNIYDSTPQRPLIYGDGKTLPTPFRTQQSMDIVGHRWILDIQATDAFMKNATSYRAIWVLVAGSLITLLSIGMMAQMGRARRLELQRVADHAKESQLQEARLHNTLEAIPYAILTLDRDGRITMANSTAAQWFDSSVETLHGQQINSLIGPRTHADTDAMQNSSTHFLSGNGPRYLGPDQDLCGRRRDGSEFPVEVQLTPADLDSTAVTLCSVIDISIRKRLEERFRQVVESVPSAILMVDHLGHIELVNSMMERWFGYPRDELLGQAIEMLIPTRFRSQHPGYRAAFLREQHARPMGADRDLFGLRKDGSEFPIEIGLNPINTDGGMFVLCLITDITNRKATEQRLRQQAEQLEQANRYKSEFLANMSHELRTPLNSILILAEQLRENRDQNLTARQTEHADIIYRSGSELLALINDILDLSKIEAGRVTVAADQVSTQELASNLLRSFKPMADRQSLQLKVTVQPGTPAHFVTDSKRLHQVVRNLVANAIKFTERGQVDIELFSIDTPPYPTSDDISPWLAIAVTDTGPGIPQDKRELIFEAFRQLDSSTSRSFGGTGLGLTIARQLAQLLGGDVRLSDPPTGGSCFTAYIPIQSQPPLYRSTSSNEQVATVAPLDKPDGGRLLVIEDDAMLANIIVNTAQSIGVQTEVASNGAQAMDMAKRNPPDGVILDLLLPDMSGWHVLRQLREVIGTHIPVQVVSCLDRPNDWQERDVYDYLVKPFDLSDLLGVLQRMTGQLANATKRILLVEDNAVESEHYAELLTKAHYQVTLAISLAAARGALRNQHFDAVILDLH